MWPVHRVESRSSISARTTSSSTRGPVPAACERIRLFCSARALLGGDVPGGQRAEPGRDAVDGGVGRGQVVDVLARAATIASRASGPERHPRTLAGDPHDIVGTQRPDVDHNHVPCLHGTPPAAPGTATGRHAACMSRIRDNVGMSRPVPAATSALRVLRLLSGQPVPVSGRPDRRPRSACPARRRTTCSAAMADEDFVVHYPDDRTWGMGLARGRSGTGSPGRNRWPGSPASRWLVSSTGSASRLTWSCCRAPTSSTWSRSVRRGARRWSRTSACACRLTSPRRAGRSSLGSRRRRSARCTPAAAAFVMRTGRRADVADASCAGCWSRRGARHATEDGEVTPGFASVAAPVEAGTIHASVAVTWETAEPRTSSG